MLFTLLMWRFDWYRLVMMDDFKIKTPHLKRLEAEAIHIFWEIAAATDLKPVMLYSIGKDSSVLLHLARKAFPEGLPFPVLHVDTTWKFKEMIEFREKIAALDGVDMLVYTNQDGVENNINPFDYSSSQYTHNMKTVALRQALDKYGFNVAFGGGRRDEEKSRAKERIMSFRDKNHAWNPKDQRPELWSIYNTNLHDGESLRAFPISNWTELDIWHYITCENIDVVPLYLAKERPVVERNGQYIMVDDDRMPIDEGETVENKSVRFRTLGCYPLTAGILSDADTMDKLLTETLLERTSERSGRLIDFDENASMEKKKREGYF